MKTKLIIILSLFCSTLTYSQKSNDKVINPSSGKIIMKTVSNKTVMAFDPKAGKYVKTLPTPKASITQRLFVPAHENNWALSQNGIAAHWERPRANEKDIFYRNSKFYYYPVATKYHQPFPYYKNIKGENKTVEFRRFSMNNILENKQYLAKDKFTSDALSGTPGKSNVYYFQKIDLQTITFNTNEEYILVTDSLFLPPSAPFKNVVIGIKENKPSAPIFGSQPNLPPPLNIKFVANVVIVQGIVSVNIPEGGIFQISSGKMLLKSPFEGISTSQLNDLPIALPGDNSKANYIFNNILNQNDKLLLNRLHLEQMKIVNEIELNATADPWQKDKILEKFQTIRFQKIRRENLSEDNTAGTNFNRQCERFDKDFKNYSFRRKRDFNNTVILCDGKIDEMPMRPIRYFGLPSLATVMAVQNDTNQLIGYIKYDSKLNVINKIEINAELAQKPEELKRLRSELSKKGIKLESNIPSTLLKIEEQALKINGKTLGKIYPVSNNLIKLEIDLVQEAKTIIDLFPKNTMVSFPLESTFVDDGSKSVSIIQLSLSPILLRKLNYEDPIKSFDVYENSSLTHQIQLVNNLFSTDKNTANAESYGALNYLEVMVEISFSNKSVIRGPYKLSAYNTQAASTLVPFLKEEPNYTLTVSGRALYESGIREIVPFSINSDIVGIDESMLK
jgi:hypothetical protein